MKTTDQLTLADLPFRSLELFQKPDLVCRCEEPNDRRLSSQQFFDSIRTLSLGLSSLGLQQGDRVALISDSCPEWVISDLAVLTAGAVTVPIYPTLSAPQIWFILAESSARFAIVSNATQVAKIMEGSTGAGALEAVIVMDGDGDGERFRVLSMADVSKRGQAALDADAGAADRYRETAQAIDPESLATIVYTSGTTGDPKGVMLTHRNIVSNVVATRSWISLSSADRLLSFLPLSHVFERVVLFRCLYDGVSVYFAETMTSVARDLVRTKPTVMTGVPRAWEKFHSAIHDGLGKLTGAKKALSAWAIGVGYEYARTWMGGAPPPGLLAFKHRLADRLVFAKVRERTGGRLRFLISGSAPLMPKIAEFFFAINLPILEAYGLTESSPGITANPPDAPRLGTVGKPFPGVEVKIGSDGEILVRGPNIMRGYYKRPEATAETLAGGWLHTGDIGELSTDGYLTITDRKKDLIVTSGGKKIAPQPLENLLKADPLISEAVLIGEQRKFPAALLVPDFVKLEARIEALKLRVASREELVRHPEVLRLYQDVLDRLNGSLAQFERVKRFALLPTEFTMERGELTPTMKVRRQVVEQRWRLLIDGIYAG
ncbi:MAG TPA: long-chain fatty acid--CoA ligase [Vicinamibacterales bacterium]